MFLCLCHALVYIPSFLACHVYFMLCSILCFCLSFEFHFLIHLASLMHHLLPLFIYSFLSLLTLDSFVYSWQKGGECTGEYTGVFHHFYMTHVHILRGRNSTLCTFVEGESHWENAYTKGEKTSFYEKTLFCLFYFMLIFLLLYGALSYIQYLCFVAFIASCFCVRHAFILMILCFIGCMFGWSFDLLYDHCSQFHMNVLCLIKLFICFTTYLLDRILLVTLYLSFYHLIYLKGLMCFVQVF